MDRMDEKPPIQRKRRLTEFQKLLAQLPEAPPGKVGMNYSIAVPSDDREYRRIIYALKQHSRGTGKSFSFIIRRLIMDNLDQV